MFQVKPKSNVMSGQRDKSTRSGWTETRRKRRTSSQKRQNNDTIRSLKERMIKEINHLSDNIVSQVETKTNVDEEKVSKVYLGKFLFVLQQDPKTAGFGSEIQKVIPSLKPIESKGKNNISEYFMEVERDLSFEVKELRDFMTTLYHTFLKAHREKIFNKNLRNNIYNWKEALRSEGVKQMWLKKRDLDNGRCSRQEYSAFCDKMQAKMRDEDGSMIEGYKASYVATLDKKNKMAARTALYRLIQRSSGVRALVALLVHCRGLSFDTCALSSQFLEGYTTLSGAVWPQKDANLPGNPERFLTTVLMVLKGMETASIFSRNSDGETLAQSVQASPRMTSVQKKMLMGIVLLTSPKKHVKESFRPYSNKSWESDEIKVVVAYNAIVHPNTMVAVMLRTYLVDHGTSPFRLPSLRAARTDAKQYLDLFSFLLYKWKLKPSLVKDFGLEIFMKEQKRPTQAQVIKIIEDELNKCLEDKELSWKQIARAFTVYGLLKNFGSTTGIEILNECLFGEKKLEFYPDPDLLPQQVREYHMNLINCFVAYINTSTVFLDQDKTFVKKCKKKYMKSGAIRHSMMACEKRMKIKVEIEESGETKKNVSVQQDEDQVPAPRTSLDEKITVFEGFPIFCKKSTSYAKKLACKKNTEEVPTTQQFIDAAFFYMLSLSVESSELDCLCTKLAAKVPSQDLRYSAKDITADFIVNEAKIDNPKVFETIQAISTKLKIPSLHVAKPIEIKKDITKAKPVSKNKSKKKKKRRKK